MKMKLVKKHMIINLILGILHMSKCKVPITDIVFSYLNCISLSLPPEILLLLKCTSNVHLYPSIMTTYSTVVGLLYSTIYIFYFLFFKQFPSCHCEQSILQAQVLYQRPRRLRVLRSFSAVRRTALL